MLQHRFPCRSDKTMSAGFTDMDNTQREDKDMTGAPVYFNRAAKDLNRHATFSTSSLAAANHVSADRFAVDILL
jgi:hypothetical protein